MLPEDFWPDSPPTEGFAVPGEPANVDQYAKPFRLRYYLRTCSELEIRHALLEQFSVSIGISITAAWYMPANGLIENRRDLPSRGMHSIPILSFDYEHKSFLFRNSWGYGWGDNGHGYLPAGMIDNYITDGWSTRLDLLLPNCRAGEVYFDRSYGEPTSRGLPFIVDVRDGANDVLIGWGHGIRKKELFDVEEIFVRPEYRRKGFGTAIVNEFKKLNNGNLPLRFLVPWGDQSELHAERLLRWFAKQNLRLERLGKRWAAYAAMDGEPVVSLPKLNWAPSKAMAPRHLLMDDAREAVAPAWNDQKSRRRAALIEKEYRESLSIIELAELERLQVEFGDYQDYIAPLPSDEEYDD